MKLVFIAEKMRYFSMSYKKYKKKYRNLTRAALVASLLLPSLISYGKDLGVVGQTYQIIEPDFLEFIQNRLHTMQQNGELAKINKQMTEQTRKHAERPIPVAGITRTQKYASWSFDPSTMIPHDITDPNGNLIAKGGTVFNPLTQVSLKEALVFYDADDKDQARWAQNQDKKLHGKDKLILVNGSIPEQIRLFSRQIYFDQAGRFTTKFKIKHVPAIVTEEDLHLKVEEVIP